jgi:hypothetical protein
LTNTIFAGTIVEQNKVGCRTASPAAQSERVDMETKLLIIKAGGIASAFLFGGGVFALAI